ncbi:MAG: transporter substrate-binding domain-containing protein [Muribaculaceae bacterium]|nr:transporter substrate-binding domain-containing protein [Muribaculaceae bacterium]MBR6432707.1 transporter substrate-binding domain-containing protein [Muribaculaceae bacterium]
MLKKLSQVKKWQMYLYGGLLLLVIALMVSLKYCNSDKEVLPSNTDSGYASKGDTLDVAIEYSPLSYYAYGDSLGGFNYEFLKLLSDSCGVPMKFHPVVSLKKALEGLENGLYDIMAAQYPVTRENKKHYLFTSALYLDKQVLVQRNTDGVAIKSQLDLAGDTVNIVKGSPMRERILSLSREIGDTIYVVSDSIYGPEQLFMMVSTGDIKYAVINESIARKMAQSHPNVDISTAISFSQFQSLTLRKEDRELCEKLNKWIAKVKKLPEYRVIYDKYLAQ